MDGTSLDDLDYSNAGTGDRDLVKDILNIVNTNNMNGGVGVPSGAPGGRPPLPVLSSRGPGGVGNLPPPSGNIMDMGSAPNSHTQYTMDSAPPQAHMIGGSQPTPADFANLMQSASYGGGGSPIGMSVGAPYMQQQHPQQQAYYQPQQFGGSSWTNTIIKEAKIPIFVAILVFLVNLPVFNILISHSLPSLISPAGGLTNGGMLVKALVAGFLFWVVQRVLAPLVATSD
jgi:hypothetical protein